MRTVTSMSANVVAGSRPFVHRALLYAGAHEYVAGIAPFVRAGAELGEPVLVAVPEPNLDLLRRELLDVDGAVRFVDMRRLGRNPGRIIAAIRGFVGEHAGTRVRFVGEPIWSGRSATETLEATRHEALINLAFDGVPATVLCPYDAAVLSAEVLADAELTHPEIVCGAACRRSERYTEPAAMWIVVDHELPPPAAPVASFPLGEDLAGIRRFVREQVAGTPIDDERVADLVIAVSEAAANALEHGGGRGVVRVWTEGGAVVCEVADEGRVGDLLADRRLPTIEDERGRGLWLVNQLCDLVQLRSGASGTTLRMHLAVEAPPSVA